MYFCLDHDNTGSYTLCCLFVVANYINYWYSKKRCLFYDRRALQLLSSGLFLPGSLGIIDPCEVKEQFISQTAMLPESPKGVRLTNFIYLFIYLPAFWTQACPEGMCTNGTQFPCKVPSLPNPTTRQVYDLTG